jgi:hypothetical protein
MSSLQTKLNRLEAWFEHQNALDDAIAKGRPSWWHAGKIVLGLMAIGKSVALFWNAPGVAGYPLALLLLAGGASLVIESVNVLRQRWMSPLI